MAPDVRAISDISSVVGAFYDKKALERLVANVVLYKQGEKKPIPKNSGNVIYFNRFTNFPTSVTKLTEGEVPTQTYLSGTSVSATLYQLGGWTAVSDMLDLTAFQPIISECAANMGDTAATSVDSRIMYDLLSEDSVETPVEDNCHLSCWFYGKQGGLSSVYISASGATLTLAQTMSIMSASTGIAATASLDGHTLDLDKIRAILAKLRAADVRPFSNGYYKGVFHPKAMIKIQRTAEWQDYNKYTRPEVLDKGFVGRADGVEFYESTIMFTTNTAPLSMTSTALSLSFGLIYGQGAWAVTEIGSGEKGIQIISKAPNSYDTSNPLNQWSTIGYKITMAAKALNHSCGYFLATIVN